jgi:hypothetical protein
MFSMCPPMWLKPTNDPKLEPFAGIERLLLVVFNGQLLLSRMRNRMRLKNNSFGETSSRSFFNVPYDSPKLRYPLL